MNKPPQPSKGGSNTWLQYIDFSPFGGIKRGWGTILKKDIIKSPQPSKGGSNTWLQYIDFSPFGGIKRGYYTKERYNQVSPTLQRREKYK